MVMNLELFHRRCQAPLDELKRLVEDNVKPGRTHVPPDGWCAYRDRLVTDVGSLRWYIHQLTEDNLLPRVIFRTPIEDVEGAKRLIEYLHANGMMFHPEDDPADLAKPKFTADESRELRHRMTEAYACEWSEFDCPCGYWLHLTSTPPP